MIPSNPAALERITDYSKLSADDLHTRLKAIVKAKREIDSFIDHHSISLIFEKAKLKNCLKEEKKINDELMRRVGKEISET